MSKKSLKDLLYKIDWLLIESKRNWLSKSLRPDQVAVGFYKKNKKSTDVEVVKIRIGYLVVEKMGWNTKDIIAIYHDPDDLFSFMLVKSVNGSGYKLQQEINARHWKLSFKWDREIKLKRRESSVVDHEIYKERIFFRASNA